MSYYIARYGRVLAWEGRRAEPPLDTSSLGFENCFEDKERAYYFRDRLREEHPRIFLTTTKQPTAACPVSSQSWLLKNRTQQPILAALKSKPMNKSMTQEDFREQMRAGVSAHLDEFWQNLSQLKPRDYVDGFLKAASFGFSRAPSEKELDAEQQEKKRLQEEQRRQQLIQRGIEVEEE